LNGTTSRVCLIGDGDETLRLLAQQLGERRHSVWQLPALDSSQEYLPLALDLVILDGRALADGGRALIESLHANPETADAAKLLILTAVPSPKLQELVLGHIDDFVSEPLRAEEMLLRVELQLQRRRHRQGAELELRQLKLALAEQQRADAERAAFVLRYEQVFKHMPIGALLVSAYNRIEAVNAAFCQFSGYSAEELLGRQTGFLVLPEEHAATLMLGQQLAAGQIDHFVLDRRRYIRKDGSTTSGRLVVHALRDADGLLQGYVGFVEDIDSRMRVEDELVRYTRYQQALAHCSLDLLSAVSDESARQNTLRAALQQLIDSSTISRAYLFRNIDDMQYGRALELVAEAWAPGQRSLRDNPSSAKLPCMPYAALPRLHRERMLAGLPSGGLVEDLYGETPTLLAAVQSESILSTQTVPVHVGGQLWGMLAFDDCVQPRQWDNADMMLLSSAASLIGQTLQRWQIEDELRASVQFLRTTGQLARVGGWAIDLTTLAIFWSEEVYQLYEVEPGTPITLEMAQSFYAPEAQPLIQAAVEEAIRTGGGWELELPLITAAGRQIWVRTQGQVEQQDGRALRLYGAIQDVTRRKQDEEQFRTAVETMLDGFAIFDSVRDEDGVICDFRFRYINEVGCRMNGRSHEEHLGRTLLEIVPAQRNSELFKSYVRLVETGAPVALESIFSDGDERSGEPKLQALDVRAARLADGFAVVWRDVSERRMALEALAQANGELLSRVYELRTLNIIAQHLAFSHDLPESLHTVCAALAELVAASQATIAVYSLPGAESLPGTRALVPDELGALAETLVKQRRSVNIALSPRQHMLSEELERELGIANSPCVLLAPLTTQATSIGLLALARSVALPFNEDEQKLVETVASQVAATIENRRLSAQAQRTAMLEERNRVARDLHDSATQALYSLVLLAGGWATTAEQGRLEAVDEKLRQIRSIALQALRELRLLIFELRHPDLMKEGLVRALEQRLAAVEQRANIRAVLSVEGELSGLSPVQEEQLFFITQEALNNALRHAQAQSIAISIQADSQLVELSVRDDGIGFDPAQPSSGMGLSSMRERAARIEAQFRVSSAPAKGTLVAITLPLNEPVQTV
jgi:PAS domain S-box-containing protein